MTIDDQSQKQYTCDRGWTHAHAVWVSPTHRSRYQARGRDLSSSSLGGGQWCAAFALSFLLFFAFKSAVDGDDALFHFTSSVNRNLPSQMEEGSAALFDFFRMTSVISVPAMRWVCYI
jgi:hypothetical protein